MGLGSLPTGTQAGSTYKRHSGSSHFCLFFQMFLMHAYCDEQIDKLTLFSVYFVSLKCTTILTNVSFSEGGCVFPFICFLYFLKHSPVIRTVTNIVPFLSSTLSSS